MLLWYWNIEIAKVYKLEIVSKNMFKGSNLERIFEEVENPERKLEVDRSGRREIYSKLYGLFDGDRGGVLELVNCGLTMVDDIVDRMDKPLEYLGRMKSILQRSFSGEEVDLLTNEEETIADLGNTLNRLASQSFWHINSRAIGKNVYGAVQKYWEIEEKYIERKGRILGREELDDFNIGVGGCVAYQFLFTLDPGMDPFFRRLLVRGYGRAVKLADNLCDFREDISNGFVNIPREDLHYLQGIEIDGDELVGVDLSGLSLSREYIDKEYERIDGLFGASSRSLYKAWLHCPFWEKGKRGLPLFGELASTWLDQLREFKEQDYFSARAA